MENIRAAFLRTQTVCHYYGKRTRVDGSWFLGLRKASGVSFLPYDDHTYEQAPYQDIDKDEYSEWMLAYGNVTIDWEKLTEFEKEDNTNGSRELACTAGVCEVVDIIAT